MRRTVPLLLLAACAPDAPEIVPPDAGDAVDVGEVGAGRMAEFAVDLRAGSEPLHVTRATIDGDGFGTVADASVRGLDVRADEAGDVADGEHVIEAGETFSWPFVVLPDARGTLSGTARFEVSGGDALEVPVTAEVVVPETVVSPTEVAFGPVAAGDAETATLTVENRGDVLLVLEATFADPDQFSTLEPQPFLVEPGDAAGFELVAQPVGDGGARSSVRLAVGDTELATVTLVVDPVER